MRNLPALLAFDIETIPDVEALRSVYGISDAVGDDDAYGFVCRLQRQKGYSDFLPLPLHRVAVISCALLEQASFRLFSLETCTDGEAEVVRRFYAGVEKYKPRLYSWNGGGFDLPVLHYRALKFGIVAETYWETGDNIKEFKWNNYVSRYHDRHLDLMDTLSRYQMRAAGGLDTVSKLCGLPGKIGMDGGQVWDSWRREDYEGIRFYCETDTVNTLLVGLEFERMRGALSEDAYQGRRDRVIAYLQRHEDLRWGEYLAEMRSAAGT